MLGVFHTARAALSLVIERRGYVSIVSSLAASAAAPGIASYNASKAAVEHFAEALRLEVAHLGVDVGAAHISWIDTATVADTKSELSTFTEMLAKLPYPLKRTTSVQQCGQAFVEGADGRKRRINSPGWVRLARWLKPLLSTAFGELPIRRLVPGLLPRIRRSRRVWLDQRPHRGTGEGIARLIPSGRGCSTALSPSWRPRPSPRTSPR